MNFDFKRMLKFEHNVGAQEKKYRMIGGAALILVSIFTAKVILLLLGMVLVMTAYSGWCPAYSGMGRSTSETQGETQQDTIATEQAAGTTEPEPVTAAAEQEPAQETEQQA